MNYSIIKSCDIANGPGVRVSLFVSGCTRHCPGCFQPETWDFSYGEQYVDEVKERVLFLLSPYYIQGLSVLGGEPFEPRNQIKILPLISEIRNRLPEKDVWIFSGYTLSELLSRTEGIGMVTRRLLSKIDVLVDGPFIEEKKDASLLFRGSSNQRLIDIQESMKKRELVLWDHNDI